MAASAATVLILWTAGLVFLLVGRWLTVTDPRRQPEKGCRLHRWTRTEHGFRCQACGWRCESGAEREKDLPTAP